MNDDSILRSPVDAKAHDIPEVPLGTFLLDSVKNLVPRLGSRYWVHDLKSNTTVRFDQVEEQSRKVASALYRYGFRPGQILLFVSMELAQLNVVNLAVWRLGGALRGCFQYDTPTEYERQLRETRSTFVLVDAETAKNVKDGISKLEWDVKLLGVGNDRVSEALNFADMLLDDGKGFPEKVDINVHEDAAIILNTSGSTGIPKGAVHTHFSVVACLCSESSLVDGVDTIMTPVSNFTIAAFTSNVSCLYKGVTVMHNGRFDPQTYVENLQKYKPNGLITFPYLISWLFRNPKIETLDLSHIEVITVGGSVLDSTTVTLVKERLPNVKLKQLYAMTETMLVTATDVGNKNNESIIASATNQGQEFLSSGRIAPCVQAKVVDIDTGKSLGAGERGELILKSPTLMRGYLTSDGPIDRTGVDAEGWFHTGDIAFFDSECNIYVVDRIKSTFKYYMFFVSPSIIEGVLSKHDAVHAVGVVAIPNDETTNLARAFVALRPGSHATTAELEDFVASRLPQHMHLHGGVRFLPELPLNKAGKLDRMELQKLATNG